MREEFPQLPPPNKKKRVKKKEKHTLIFIEAWIIEKISTGCVFCGSAFAFYRSNKNTWEGCIEFSFKTAEKKFFWLFPR